MKILSITATNEQILFACDLEKSPLTITEYQPLAAGKGEKLFEATVNAENGICAIPRFDGAHDRLYSRFCAQKDGECVPGAKYVTKVDSSVPENTAPYPVLPSKKTLYGTDEDLVALGLTQTPMNINLPAIMQTEKGEDTIEFAHDGKTYYFIRKKIEDIDHGMLRAHNNGIVVTMILLNSPRLFGSTGEKALLDDCLHPAFDFDSKDAFISAFNMRTPEGQGYYRAFVEFLAQRYTRPDAKYGRAGGAIISNEVNSQYVWGNAGEMAVSDYVEEYHLAMRQAWLCGQKHASHFRVYVSLDQHWHNHFHNPLYPMRYYASRDVIDNLALEDQKTGSFPWCVAFHPYPEDLRWPDFWHDRAPDFTFTTPKITFKNMEVLEAYLSQPQLLFEGEPRRIIFSEQGFNSQSGPLQNLTEKMAEAGYVLAYLKARNMKTVDMFMHHAYIDNPHEFGLNLGIRRYDANADHHAGEKKPIYYAVYDMDTEREPARIEKARAFIGEELFDYLLNPPIEYGDRDDSKDNEFG